MLKISEIFESSRENSYFERIRMVRMVRMVRSLADRTFQLWGGRLALEECAGVSTHPRPDGRRLQVVVQQPGSHAGAPELHQPVRLAVVAGELAAHHLQNQA